MIEKNQEEAKVYLNTPSLTGPQSVLPEYFQNSIVDGFSRGDHRLRRFLALFDDRVLRLSRLLSCRSPLAIRHESQQQRPDDRAVFQTLPTSTQQLENEASYVEPEQLFQYLAHMMPRFRALRGMRDLLTDFVGLRVTVSVTVEEPIMLPDSSVSRLGAGDGYLNQLGGVLMLGSQSSFYFRRLIAVLHVDSKSRFDSLVADKTIIREIKELLRLYTRTSAPTRIMLSCARKYLVPPRLPSRDHPGFRLGRTTVFDPHRKPDEIIETEFTEPRHMTQLLLTELVAKLDAPLCAALERAAGNALSSGSDSIEIEHWLLEILESNDESLDEFLKRQKVDELQLRGELQSRLPRESGVSSVQPTLSAELVKLVKDSWLLASVNYSDDHVQMLHLVLGLLQQEVLGIQTLRYEAFSELSLEAVDGQIETTASAEDGQGQGKGQGKGGNRYSSHREQRQGGSGLDRYAINLTEEAKEGRLGSVVGRSDELHQLIDILARKGKNNPILVGEPGVGKTAVVEALARG